VAHASKRFMQRISFSFLSTLQPVWLSACSAFLSSCRYEISTCVSYHVFKWPMAVCDGCHLRYSRHATSGKIQISATSKRTIPGVKYHEAQPRPLVIDTPTGIVVVNGSLLPQHVQVPVFRIFTPSLQLVFFASPHPCRIGGIKAILKTRPSCIDRLFFYQCGPGKLVHSKFMIALSTRKGPLTCRAGIATPILVVSLMMSVFILGL